VLVQLPLVLPNAATIWFSTTIELTGTPEPASVVQADLDADTGGIGFGMRRICVWELWRKGTFRDDQH